MRVKIACVAIAGACLVLAPQATGQQRLFSTADGVQGVYFADSTHPFVCDEQQRRCVTTIFQRSIQTGHTTYSIILLDVAEARRSLSSSTSVNRFVPRTLARFETLGVGSENEDGSGIRHLRWVGDDALAFVGRDLTRTRDIDQVFRLALRGARLSQLSRSSNGVADYWLSQNGALLFSAWPNRAIAPGTPQLIGQRDELSTRGDLLRYYFQPHPNVEAREIAGCSAARGSSMSLSSTGHLAYLECVPRSVPASWFNYQVLAENYREAPSDSTGNRVPIGSDGRYFILARRAYLFDTARGSLTALLDAPLGTGSISVEWAPDNRSLSVSGAYPPQALCIATQCQTNASGQIGYAEQNGTFEIDLTDMSRVRRTPPRENASELQHPFVVVQSRIHPPEIGFRAGDDDSPAATLTNFNADLSTVPLGHFEDVSWRSTNRPIDLTATMLFPPRYVAGDRYPVVLALNPAVGNEALFDEGYWQELAARGIIIISPSSACYTTTRTTGTWAEISDAALTSACVDDVAEYLTERGLLDGDRLGLAGFSHSGSRALDAVAISGRRIAAATVTDSAVNSLAGYSQAYGSPHPFPMAQFDGLSSSPYAFAGRMGSAPWGDGLINWLDHATLFNLDRIRTPIRFEEHSVTVGVAQTWEIYAILRHMGGPADYVVLPEESHSASTARGAFANREGIADWYDFWLNDHEDPAPEKAEQYRRWRVLRMERDALAHTPRPNLRRWRYEDTGSSGYPMTPQQ